MNKLFFLITIILVTNLSFGSGKRTERRGASTSTDSITTTPTSDTYLQTGFILPVLPDSGETGFGFSFGVLTQTELSSRLYVGGDLGLHFWGKLSGTSNTTGLQITPTAIYMLGSTSSFAPYFGLSAGPYLDFGGATGTGANFLMVFRPGVNWNIGKKVTLNGEGKFGTYAGALVVMPVINLNIYL